jgi:hypothetical protein
MKQIFIACILLSLFASPLARAEDSYAGLMYAQLGTENAKTDNLGLVIGHVADEVVGLEGFYTTTTSRDTATIRATIADVSLDSYGILGVYKTAGEYYLKVKAGWASVEIKADYKASGSAKGNTTGFAYGLTLGADVGDGSVELSYLVLPAFDELLGIPVNANNDMASIAYVMNF